MKWFGGYCHCLRSSYQYQALSISGLHGRETGRTGQDGRDRLKCPRDGSFKKVPRIFIFLLKRSPKNMTNKEEKKNRSGRAELRAAHSGALCKLIL